MPNNYRGFSLVEVMISIAVVGILAVLAIPGFLKYQARSKTTEAKLQLAAAFTSMTVFNIEYKTYHACLNYMNYVPTEEIAQRYFTVGFSPDHTPCTVCDTKLVSLGGRITGIDGCQTGVGKSIFPAGKNQGSTPAITTFSSVHVGTTSELAITPTTFTIGAVGVIDEAFSTSANAAAFSINHNKLMIQVRNGY